MPGVQAYSRRYPRQGDVAVLCEGDVAGFELDLIEKWTALRNPQIEVDVWPCGTRAAMFGMSDAIGRARPLAVIEDRDYRTAEEAMGECERIRKDREKRAVTVRFWRAWARNEIENYLLEPPVLFPVPAKQFRISEDVVRDRLIEVIRCAAVDQAAQRLLYRLGRSLPHARAERYQIGLPRNTARPRFESMSPTIIVPSLETVRHELLGLCTALLRRVQQDAGDAAGTLERELGEFDRHAAAWHAQDLASPEWRIDWAGKDVLLLLLRRVSAEFGWPDTGGRQLKVN